MASKHSVLRVALAMADPRSYLEVGVQHGRSIGLVPRSAAAWGVDPRAEVRFPVKRDTRVISQTADEFFDSFASEADVLLGSNGHLDFGFVDGMHLAEFALRDALNMLAWMSSGSLLVLDDTCPDSLNASRRVRGTAPGPWAGDVFRVPAVLRQVFGGTIEAVSVAVPPAGLTLMRVLAAPVEVPPASDADALLMGHGGVPWDSERRLAVSPHDALVALFGRRPTVRERLRIDLLPRRLSSPAASLRLAAHTGLTAFRSVSMSSERSV